MPRFQGHLAGVDSVRSTVRYLNNHYHLKYLTLYGFSTENWCRPDAEVSGIFQILKQTLQSELDELHEEGVKLCHLGRIGELPQGLQEVINTSAAKTRNNPGMTLGFAFNYGGRAEILDGLRRIISQGLKPEQVDEGIISANLYTAGMPDVDLLIRTGGEMRVSNFLIWQAAYAEYYFTDTLWPDFDKAEIDKALACYKERQRRFGGL